MVRCRSTLKLLKIIPAYSDKRVLRRKLYDKGAGARCPLLSWRKRCNV